MRPDTIARTHAPATLLAQGAADALGCPFEVPEKAPLLHPGLADWDGGFRSTRGGWHDLEPGQWSDDTQFAVALAEALLADGRFSTDTVAEHYVALYKRGIRGAGGTCKKALAALSEGVSPLRSGVEGAEGNGTAMRAAPIGLLLHGWDLPDVMDVARADARITHRSVEAQEGSAAVAAMVALLARGADRRWALKEVCAHLRPSSRIRTHLSLLHVLADGGLGSLEVWPGPRDEVTVSGPRGADDPVLPVLLKEFGTRGHVVQTVPSAFACFMLTGSYERAVMAAVRGGGDADTTAAITGALAGTWYGADGVPELLRRGVERGDMLSDLDARLFAAGKK